MSGGWIADIPTKRRIGARLGCADSGRSRGVTAHQCGGPHTPAVISTARPGVYDVAELGACQRPRRHGVIFRRRRQRMVRTCCVTDTDVADMSQSEPVVAAAFAPADSTRTLFSYISATLKPLPPTSI